MKFLLFFVAIIAIIAWVFWYQNGGTFASQEKETNTPCIKDQVVEDEDYTFGYDDRIRDVRQGCI